MLPAALVGSPLNGVVLRHLKRQIQEISRIIRTNTTISSWLLHIVDANGRCQVWGREAVRRRLGAHARTACVRASCQSKQHDAKGCAAGQRSSGVEPPHGNHAAYMLFKSKLLARRWMQGAGAGGGRRWDGAGGGSGRGERRVYRKINTEFTETWYRFGDARSCPLASQVGRRRSSQNIKNRAPLHTYSALVHIVELFAA